MANEKHALGGKSSLNARIERRFCLEYGVEMYVFEGRRRLTVRGIMK